MPITNLPNSCSVIMQGSMMSKIKLSCDDGCASDLRVAELCVKYKIDCTFYLPVEWRSLAYDNGYTPLSFVDALQIARNFEVGSHTCTHRHLTKIPLEDAYTEIFDSQIMLQGLFQQPIKKFSPPRGYTNEKLTDYTLGLYKSQRLTKGEGLVHIHPNSGANGNRPWRECITEETTECWMHSWELDRYPEEWVNLETFLKELSEKE